MLSLHIEHYYLAAHMHCRVILDGPPGRRHVGNIIVTRSEFESIKQLLERLNKSRSKRIKFVEVNHGA